MRTAWITTITTMISAAVLISMSVTGCNQRPLDHATTNQTGGAGTRAGTIAGNLGRAQSKLPGTVTGGASALTGPQVNNSRPPTHIGSASDRPYDTPSVDADGDGDRIRWSGRNTLNNPPVDIRAQAPAHRGSPLTTNGRFAGNGYGDTIANLALSIPGVASSVAVTHGRVVIVGIGLSNQSPLHNVSAIQREMRRRVAVQAPELRYVYVTTDANQVMELNRIADGLRSGTPASAYLGRMEYLMRTMRPIPLY